MRNKINWDTAIVSFVMILCTSVLSYIGKLILDQTYRIPVIEEKIRVLDLRVGSIEDRIYKKQ